MGSQRRFPLLRRSHRARGGWLGGEVKARGGSRGGLVELEGTWARRPGGTGGGSAARRDEIPPAPRDPCPAGDPQRGEKRKVALPTGIRWGGEGSSPAGEEGRLGRPAASPLGGLATFVPQPSLPAFGGSSPSLPPQCGEGGPPGAGDESY